jgi:hypothetical protein
VWGESSLSLEFARGVSVFVEEEEEDEENEVVEGAAQ